MCLIFILAQSLQNGFDMVGSILLKRVVIRVRKFKNRSILFDTTVKTGSL